MVRDKKKRSGYFSKAIVRAKRPQPGDWPCPPSKAFWPFRVRVTVAGAESFTAELLRSSLPDPNANARVFFLMVPGRYTYTSQALQGSSVLSTIGPVPLTAAANFPLDIPLINAFAAFDHYQTDVGPDTPNTLLYIGTDDRDRIAQYGGAANHLLSVDMGTGDDWSEQYGGGGDDTILANSGLSNDYNDKINVLGGDYNNYIYQNGGPDKDEIFLPRVTEMTLRSLKPALVMTQSPTMSVPEQTPPPSMAGMAMIP